MTNYMPSSPKDHGRPKHVEARRRRVAPGPVIPKKGPHAGFIARVRRTTATARLEREGAEAERVAGAAQRVRDSSGRLVGHVTERDGTRLQIAPIFGTRAIWLEESDLLEDSNSELLLHNASDTTRRSPRRHAW